MTDRSVISYHTGLNRVKGEKGEVVQDAAANMPEAVARTSTRALTNATMEYFLQIASKGFRQAIRHNPGFAKGVNVIHGKVTYSAVAEALNLPYTLLKKP
jgi:alanine dehydrogenase